MSISSIGNYSLLLSIIILLITIIVPLNLNSKKHLFYSYNIINIICFIILLLGFIIDDFSIKIILFNSNTNKSMIYKIASSWSSYEGSMILWMFLFSIMSITAVYYNQISNISKSLQINILSIIQFLFLVFIYYMSNPFETLNISNLPTNGIGLNPALHDHTLIIHPPLLYLGYVGYVIPFSMGCIILITKDNYHTTISYIKKFANISIASLSLGITTGAWWAYRELGWGGFWFFDPVENISLIIWIAGIMLHHFLLISLTNVKYLRWTIILSIVIFTLILYGIFIVRSGIIDSIHSFTSSIERSQYILFIAIVTNLISIMIFLVRHKHVKLTNTKYQSCNKNKYIFWSNILWLISLTTLLLSIIYPIYYRLVYGEEIVIDSRYFIKIFIPLNIPMIILAGLVPCLNYSSILVQIFLILSSLIITSVINIYLDTKIMNLIMIFSAIYLIFSQIYYIKYNSNNFCNTLNTQKISSTVGHIGFAILVLNITLNSILSKEISFTGKLGDELNKDNISIKLQNIRLSDQKDYIMQISEFLIRYDNTTILLTPETRLYKAQKHISQKSDIYSFLFYDIYSIVSKIENNIVHAQISYRAHISFIWLSSILISISFILCIYKKIPYKRLKET
ncbi:cytochrome c-type biogenesis CcmF C-terminal domain-containing protein [Rickettsia endosymbiont of Cardiosporidium cionae]|uniref:cytochrome c-type biogenesis CcmF C-terminal domain-containing protein n=1 Tax=Rickettsia endosymbiont of Cardiosporidium cionae TaxID=2777155 RepID=UPI001892F70B|nr:cytochrome c-type biogenesis CcmF C-terminal domain-containing protein [Rickettsia endosymbiont of Cardiosporidium cionae]KAF8818234.1 heme lyase CcmF/NrfE family subunit [Rickettsia endosymbiont of Cardiosporidium cionae]